ncbi:hypothetical protein ACHAXT_010536 [Thalassiosira profunda]
MPIPMGKNLTWLLSINKEAKRRGVSYAIRQKMKDFYFQGNFDVRCFSEMDVTIMPHLLSFVQTSASDEEDNSVELKDWRYNINGIYQVLRNCHVSEMFSFPGPKSVAFQLWEKDERIKQLEAENNQLKQENKELRLAGPAYPNKRAKTSS